MAETQRIAADRERAPALLAYGLMLIAPVMGGLSALIGVVIAHLRLADARGGLYESHYRNQILVFWVWLGAVAFCAFATMLGMANAAFSFLLPSPFPMGVRGLALFGGGLMLIAIFVAMVVLCVWYYWRLIRGFLRALDEKAY
jgi:uncharacterized membrane protein